MNQTKVRVGVIGGSIHNGWAKHTHIPVIQQLPAYELSAVSTSRLDSAKKSATEFMARHAFDNAKEMASHSEVDMVVVSINVKEHYNVVKEMIPTGKPIYCEWPLGSNTEQAFEMQQWVDTNQIVNAVGLQARQAPAINYVNDLVKNGFIGRLMSVNMKANMNIMGGIVQKGNEYHYDRKIGGNLLTIGGGHAIDALMYMFGEFKELSSITIQQYDQAHYEDSLISIPKDTPDQILIAGTLVGGEAASIHIQGGSPHQGVVLEICGEEGTIVLSSSSMLQIGPYSITCTKKNGSNQKIISNELVIPNSYYWIPENLNHAGGPALNVAQAYVKFVSELATGHCSIATFKDAVKLHQLLDVIQRETDTGERQYL